MERRPTKIMNVETGEVYPSLTAAGYKLGYLTTLKLPPHVLDDPEAEFTRRGVRLKIVPNE